MLIRPRFIDFKIILYYLSRAMTGFALLMFVPLIIALLYSETNPAIDYCIGIIITLIVGITIQTLFYTKEDLNFMHSMVLVSLLWIFAMFFSAIPLYLSGHMGSFLDACFETMSGLTTTGLSLSQDLDHMSRAHNFWRHFLIFIGGQGIIVVAISILIKSTSGAVRLYIGEARDERLMPNVIHTARSIWLISLFYLILCSSILSGVLVLEGFDIKSAIFNGICLFMATFDTGGFGLMSQNILFYHSPLLEITSLACMLLGAMNFHLHYKIMTGDRKEIYKNIEIRTFFLSILILSILVLISVQIAGEFNTVFSVFRKGFFQIISAHTGCGLQTIPASEFKNGIGYAGCFAIIIAMGLGGAVNSTAGGIKSLRIGILSKAIIREMRKMVLPERTVIIQKFHHIKDMVLQSEYVKAAALMTISYIVLILIGSLAGMFLGYGFVESIFESASASGNVGLTIGVTQPSMHWFLKIVYIVQMLAGRLEFLSIFSLIGFFMSIWRGK